MAELQQIDERISASEFVEKLLQQLYVEDGVTHLTVHTVNEQGEQKVLILHVEVEAVMNPEEFLEALDEATDEQESITPTIQ